VSIPGVEIVSVLVPDAPVEGLRGFALESPAAGETRDEQALSIAGWAVGRSSAVNAVEVVHEERMIREALVRRPHPEALAAHPDIAPATNTGFSATVGVLGLDREFELGLRAVLENGDRIPIGKVRARRALLPPPVGERLRPLRVTCMRRSGSTWLMHLLAAHPEVVVFPRYPYESTPARYWAHMTRVLSEPADWVASTTPVSFASNPRQIGHNPYYDDAVDDPRLREWYGGEYLGELAAFARRSADGWYRRVATTQEKTHASLFAEKHIVQLGELPALWDELYPGGSEVLLVRDFRDMAYSAMSFDRAHGRVRFSEHPGGPEEVYVQRVKRRAERLRHIRETQVGAHVIRYEALVERPKEVLRSLLDHIGVDASPPTVEAILREAAEPIPGGRRHVTAPSVEQSVGRWRDEADDSFRALCDTLLGDALRAFEYV
jgi:LPS sulfotransferase NodH